MSMSALDKWYGYIKSHDHRALWDLLHPDAVFESPVVHTPQRGREITFKYLASAGKVLGGPSFRYASRTRFIPESLLGLFDRTSWPPVVVGAPAGAVSQG